MIRITFKRSRNLILIGCLAALSANLVLPPELGLRIWVCSLLGMCAPVLVLGRDRERQRGRWRNALSPAIALPTVCIELLPALLVVLIFSLSAAWGHWAVAVIFFLWSAALVTMADMLDRAFGDPAPAFGIVLVLMTAAFTAPLWLAPWFGQAPWAPWLTTMAIRLHPAGAALSAAGLNTLKDPVFYQTIGVHLEVKQVAWVWGAGLLAGVCLLGLGGAVLAAGRTPIYRTWIGTQK